MTFRDKILNIGKSNKIFGIGLPKTGTHSLNKALRILKYRSYHYPLVYVALRALAVPISDWDNINLEGDIMASHFFFPKKQPELSFKFNSWDALTNFGEHIYPLLDREFSNSKFILTIRDKDLWLESVKYHMRETSFFNKDGSPRGGLLRVLNNVHVFQYFRYHEEYFSILYDNHVRNIKHYFRDRPNDLLIIDICGGEGWGKLCPFLEKDIPSIKFPDKSKSPSSEDKEKYFYDF